MDGINQRHQWTPLMGGILMDAINGHHLLMALIDGFNGWHYWTALMENINGRH